MHERELLVRWMMTGPGGYTEHRLTLRVPDLFTVLVALSLLALGLELWLLWKR